jgi:5-formyltetrahydrofolate cyclo-ligase
MFETSKQEIRTRIWNLLEQKNISRFPAPHGRIPNFVGAEKAAERLSKLDVWKKADTIFVNPDSPQRPVRELALLKGKKVIMATPKLKKGYLLINPVKGLEHFASTIKGAFKFGKRLAKLPKADLVVTGSVAVDLHGNRIGKGSGYGDKEIARLRKEKSITDETPKVTTVHDLQVLSDFSRLAKEYDEKIDIIITPTKVIKCVSS